MVDRPGDVAVGTLVALADRVAGVVLVGEGGAHRQQVDPDREPLLGLERGVADGELLVAEEVGDGADESAAVAEGHGDVGGAGRLVTAQ